MIPVMQPKQPQPGFGSLLIQIPNKINSKGLDIWKTHWIFASKPPGGYRTEDSGSLSGIRGIPWIQMDLKGLHFDVHGS